MGTRRIRPHALVWRTVVAAALAIAVLGSDHTPAPSPAAPSNEISPERYTGATAAAYALAKQHRDVLPKIHCHCGCAEQEGHRSLLDCFTSDHAASCEICVNEVKDVDMMLKSGLSVEDISDAIDRRYGVEEEKR